MNSGLSPRGKWLYTLLNTFSIYFPISSMSIFGLYSHGTACHATLQNDLYWNRGGTIAKMILLCIGDNAVLAFRAIQRDSGYEINSDELR